MSYEVNGTKRRKQTPRVIRAAICMFMIAAIAGFLTQGDYFFAAIFFMAMLAVTW